MECLGVPKVVYSVFVHGIASNASFLSYLVLLTWNAMQNSV